MMYVHVVRWPLRHWGFWLLVLLAAVLMAVGRGVVQVNHEVDQWHPAWATVVKPGTDPKGPEGNQTDTEVSVKRNGQVLYGTVPLYWWDRGPVWVWVNRDGKISLQDPAAITRYANAILIKIAWVVLVFVVLLVLWGLALLKARDITARQRVPEEADRAAPQSLRELVALCGQYGDIRVGISFATEYSCTGGVLSFRDQYFPDREYATLEELAPLMCQKIFNRTYLLDIVVRRLKDCGAVRSDYNVRAHDMSLAAFEQV